MATILETERLRLREVTADDAGFILELLNTPKFLKYIGDRGVRTIEQAAAFLEERYVAGYRQHGYGLYLVERMDGRVPVGINGFVNRSELPHPDIGFAFLPAYERQGYGLESSQALLLYGRETLGFQSVLAIVAPGNTASVSLLGKLGFLAAGQVNVNGDDLDLFSWNASL